MKASAAKDFPFSPDGIRVVQVKKGETLEINPKSRFGMIAAGQIEGGSKFQEQLKHGMTTKDVSSEDNPVPGKQSLSESIAAAVRGLDPETDEHWTDAGLPAMAAVEESVGTKDIKRADVAAAVPGWDRDKALEAATQPEDV